VVGHRISLSQHKLLRLLLVRHLLNLTLLFLLLISISSRIMSASCDEYLYCIQLLCFLGNLDWGLTLLVCEIHIRAFLNQKLEQLISSMLGCIEETCLTMHVYDVDVCTHLNKLSDEISSVLSHCVVNRRLTILILVVEIAAMLDEDFDKLAVVFSSSVVYCCLFECVFILRINSFAYKVVCHLNTSLFAFNMRAEENGSLFESLVEDVFRINLVSVQLEIHSLKVPCFNSLNHVFDIDGVQGSRS
jgi:hypothetical protein